MNSSVDHLTYEIPEAAIISERLDEFFALFGAEPVPVQEAMPEELIGRWYRLGTKTIHLVARRKGLVSDAHIGLGHFCVYVADEAFESIQRDGGDFIERDSGSGRVWLGFAGVRVEVRSPLRVVHPGESPAAAYEPPEISDREAIDAGQRFLDEHKEETTFRVIVQSILKELSKGSGPTFVGKALSGCEAGEEVQVRLERPVTYTFPPQPPLEPIVLGNYLRQDVEPQHWEVAQVLDKALAIYKERNEVYKDNWKKQGWRGNLFKLRLKCERFWDSLWNKDNDMANSIDQDDLYDLINYAVFTILSIEDGNAGGWFKDA